MPAEGGRQQALVVTAEGGMTCLPRQTAGAGGYCRRGYDLPVKGDSRRWWLLQKAV